MFRLDNKIAAVTGGGSGIGESVCKVLAQQGAIVHVVDVSEVNAKQTLEEIAAAGGKGDAHACSVIITSSRCWKFLKHWQG